MSVGTTKKITGQNLAVTFADTDDWGSGFVGQITIANTGTSDMSGWTIAFDLPENITNIWNATIVSHVGNHYVITAASWDSTIKAGGNVSFGFQAAGGNPPAPSSYVINGQTLSDTPQPPVASIGASTVNETGASTVNEVFTVTLSAASSTPVTLQYNTVDGTAKAGTDYTTASGTLTFAPGVTSQTITIATHPGVAGSHSYSVALSNPTGATIATPQGTGTIVDPTPPPPPPLPALAIGNASVTETGAGTVNETFTVTLSAPATGPVTVKYSTVDGTAKAGTDYTAASGTLTFAAGVTSQTITVATHPGAAGNHSFGVTLSNPTGATIATAQGTGTIVDPTPPPSLSIANTSVTETGVATVNETFTVTLSAPATGPVTVGYATVDGTAKAGTDYTAVSGILTFAAGVTSQTITVATHPGAAGSHSFGVALSNPTGATVATPQGTGTIVDPTPPPSLAVGDATVTEGISGSVNEVFTVTLSGAASSPVTVHYGTADGTAKAGTDYTATSGTLTFAPGTTSQTIAVTTNTGAAGTHAYTVVLSQPSGATIADNSGTGTIIDPSLPSIAAQNASVQVGVPQGGSGAGALLPAGYLSTSGNQIVDANGNDVKIAAVNWFGMETSSYAPGGLWAANYQTMMQQMVASGFNAIRLPFSLQLFDPGSTPNGINYNLNPDLQGLNGLQIMDKIVGYAGQIGLKIILDDHRSAAGSGPNADGLWHDSGYTEQQWISTWKMLAQHYANNSTVIGADLSNEPHGPATWGDGGPNDWAAAATRAGDAIQTVNPNMLILVEGIEQYNGQYDWWGGNLMGVAQHPVVLTDPNKVVYSPHDYPSSVYDQPWFNAANYPNNLPAVWNQYWGYIYQDNIAPVLLGEFGTNLTTTSDQQWLAKLVNYMNGDFTGSGNPVLPAGQQGISWAYWDWNPNSSDTGGILQNDWKTVNQAKLTAIDPAMYHPSNGASPSPQAVNFTVTLSAPSTQAITVNYATQDGTAKAGVNYVATQGTLTFAPGVTSAVISAQVLDPTGATGQMQFLLDFSSPANASLISPSATATLDYGGSSSGSGSGSGSSGSGSGTTTTGGASLHVDNDWGSGLTATVTVANGGTLASSGWQVELDTADVISNVWSGVILSHQGNTYIIGNATWNGTTAPGASTSFGFQASETAAGAPIATHLVKFT